MPSTFCMYRLRKDELYARCIGSDVDKPPYRFYDTKTAGAIRRFVPRVRIETFMMSRRIRKIAVITAMVLFATFATQAILFAHLLLEGHQHEHDSQNCPVCQQLLSLPQSTTVEEQTAISQHPFCEQSLVFHIEVASAISITGILGSRAPPVVS